MQQVNSAQTAFTDLGSDFTVLDRTPPSVLSTDAKTIDLLSNNQIADRSCVNKTDQLATYL